MIKAAKLIHNIFAWETFSHRNDFCSESICIAKYFRVRALETTFVVRAVFCSAKIFRVQFEIFCKYYFLREKFWRKNIFLQFLFFRNERNFLCGKTSQLCTKHFVSRAVFFSAKMFRVQFEIFCKYYFLREKL